MTPSALLLSAVTPGQPATLAAIDWSRIAVGGTLALFVVVCVLLVLTILIQKPQGGGLSGAFGAGSGGSGQTAFGTKTGDALTWMTIGMFVIYLATAIGMNYTMRPPSQDTTVPSASALPRRPRASRARRPRPPMVRSPPTNPQRLPLVTSRRKAE
ncbi:MAG: preprotein translocase subunit SecG [Phycisphaerales bacterium]